MSQRSEPTATAAIPLRIWAPIDAGSAEAGRTRSTTPAATYRELRLRGFADDEAGNLTAYMSGIRPVEGGWTPREIERLLFMRHLVTGG